MIEYAPPPRWQAGVFDTIERTSAIQSPSVRKTIYEIVRSNSGSVFVGHLDRFSNLERELAGTENLPANWNSNGSPAPSADAISIARKVLDVLRTAEVVPRKVMASAEGGVAIVFTSSGDNRAVIESLNDGDLSLLLYDRRSGNAENLDWDWTGSGQAGLVLALREHLQGAHFAAL
jgi:hypothetical protein